MSLADPRHVAEQYKDASRLDARVRIYELYDTSAERWLAWLFARLRLAPGERVLELGCGTGSLWRENAARVPALGALVLTDLSPAMLEQARARLAGVDGLAPEYRVEDAQSLALPDASFDVVLASHMLYHVPERARALAEVRRVLRPGGRFFATTNGWTHLIELRELLTRFSVASAMSARLRDPDELDLEAAAEEIAQAGLEVARVERRTSALEIRAVEPLLAYVRSMIDGPAPTPEALAPLARHVARQIELTGSLHVGIAAGVIEARRPMSRGDRPDPEQIRTLARLDPAAKLEVARRLRDEALALKEAWLRTQHPSENDATIRKRPRAWQLYGRAWLD